MFIFLGVAYLIFRNWQISKSDYNFHISDTNINVTTSKRYGKFYVIFDNTDISDSADYLEVKTGGDYLITFDPKNKSEINFMYSGGVFLKKNEIKYNIHIYENRDEKQNFMSTYFASDSLKNMYIDTRYYTVILDGDTLKKGSIWGGT
ncbi:hypothetical protein D0T87_20045 [Bacteroides sp. 51]|nr:hypothetical protein [Bacteroides sp. 51]